jgi:hypothetical protein
LTVSLEDAGPDSIWRRAAEVSKMYDLMIHMRRKDDNGMGAR